jgi:hypothetical protein
MRLLLTILFYSPAFFVTSLNAQRSTKAEKGFLLKKNLSSTNRIVMRSGIHAPVGLRTFISGETKLLKRITLYTEFGSAFSVGRSEFASADPRELADIGKIGIVGYATPEIRYFYRIFHKDLVDNETYKNFSGSYIAVKYFASTPNTIFSNSTRASFKNVSAWQINAGFQTQYKNKAFLGVFLGWIVSDKPLNPNYANVIPILQFGLTVGLVL